MTKHDKNIVAEDPMAVLKTKNYTTDIASMKDKVSEAEWEARVNLAAVIFTATATAFTLAVQGAP